MWTTITRRQHSRTNLRYGADLTDAEWAVIRLLLPALALCGVVADRCGATSTRLMALKRIPRVGPDERDLSGVRLPVDDSA